MVYVKTDRPREMVKKLSDKGYDISEHLFVPEKANRCRYCFVLDNGNVSVQTGKRKKQSNGHVFSHELSALKQLEMEICGEVRLGGYKYNRDGRRTTRAW